MVDVDTDGLQVFLSGIAPSEGGDRFRALSIAGTRVDAGRLIDQMDVIAAAAITPPRFRSRSCAMMRGGFR